MRSRSSRARSCPRRCATALALALGGTATSCDGDDAPPDACPSAHPLHAGACSAALDARCREQLTAEDCEAQGPFAVDIFTFACNWARRVTIADVSGCSISEASNVCVAVSVDPAFSCADGCSGDTGSQNTLVASNSADELLVLRCPQDGAALRGPIDASQAYRTCSPDTHPGGRSELCDCREQVCDAVEAE